MYGVIMAGGGGTRLWPKSREHNPKQMHALTGDQPLVREMAERLQRIIGEDRVYIITNTHQAPLIQDIMPSIADKVLIDPYRRDTAACVGLAAVYLSKVDPQAVMGTFSSDHFIGSEEEFGKVVRTAGKLAKEGYVVTIGIRPTGPETGYGYIEMGEPIKVQEIYNVNRFVEKPNRKKAEEYVAAGNYLWNSGMFAWSIPTVFQLFEKHLPDTYERLMRIRSAIDTPEENKVLHHEYSQMERISVDYGIMEKLDDIVVLPGDFGWNDIGSWATVCDISSKDDDGNAVRSLHIGLDTKNCLIVGTDKRVITTIGIEDLLVIDTDDALLICPKDRAQDVKKIVDRLKEHKMEGYL